jgi:hypothetical protein
MKRRLLDGTRVYLSGPMDFVASRANEAKFGWRNRVGEFLARLGVTVFDPWNKPQVPEHYSHIRIDAKRQGPSMPWTCSVAECCLRRATATAATRRTPRSTRSSTCPKASRHSHATV